MSLTIFLTGGTGQVGFELKRSLAPLGNVVAPSRKDVDLQDLHAVRSALRETRPDLIVNAAAYTAVDQAESDKGAAYRLNAELPAILAGYAQNESIPLVHYSTDYVYPGTGETPWTEDAITAPLSVYGKSKLQGDLAIHHANPEHLIFRTSWVYDARGKNFMNTMLRLGQSKTALKVIDDQIGVPTSARLIADVTLLALRGGMHNPATATPPHPVNPIPSGTYHLAPRGETSWHGFATAIFRLASSKGIDLALTPSDVAPIPTSEYPTPAKRPLNSRLSVTKIESTLGITMPHWHAQLDLVLSEALGLPNQ